MAMSRRGFLAQLLVSEPHDRYGQQKRPRMSGLVMRLGA